MYRDGYHASHEYVQSRQEPEVPEASQTQPYADPCTDGEEKAEDDNRRPLALIKLSSVSRGVKIASGGDRRSIAITPVKEIARQARCLAYLECCECFRNGSSRWLLWRGVADLQNLCRPEWNRL
jgi:hypothetical protein